MGIYRKAVISLAIALVVFFSSMFISFVPCKISPAPLNSESFWSYCSLSPDNALSFQTSQVLYLGYLESLETAYFTLILGIFLISFLISIVVIKSQKH